MIGYGLKKFAKENAMQVDAGVAYGVFRGYGVTLQEGQGYKQLTVSTSIADSEGRQKLEQAVAGIDRQYRIQRFTVALRFLDVVFVDNPGTMKKMQEFMDWLFPVLDAVGATKADVCGECGMAITEPVTWLLRNNTIAVPVHKACADRVCEAVERENQARLEERTGSYLTGAVGAVLGSLLGAVVWAIVLVSGWVAGIVGFLIGFLADKGYTLLKGKQGKGKLPIMIVAIILGVLAGTVGGTMLIVLQVMQEQGLELIWFADFLDALVSEEDFVRSVASSGFLGLVFAALGTFSMLRLDNKRIRGEKPRILK